MPSGFQQDTNQLSPDFYRVVITMSGGTATWTAASPANGAVNPYNWDSYTTLPSSDANGQRLSRGNMRWQAIIEEVTKHADAQIIDVEVTSADTTDANSIPTAIAFTVRYDRDDFVLGAVQKIATTFTPTTGGAVTIDTTAKALRYLVAQGILRGGTAGYTRTYNTYLFSSTEGTQPSITITRPDTDADIYDDVAVQVLDGTELVSTV
jgi:hypothetical protein